MGLEIEGIEVNEDTDRNPVIYVPPHAQGDRNHKDCEVGTISSYNDRQIWVKFSASSGQLCPISNLQWK